MKAPNQESTLPVARHRRARVLQIGVLFLSGILGTSVVAAEDLLDLINPLLGPKYARWLVGPIAELATEKEKKAYLELIDDDSAKAFAESFWSGSRSGIRAAFDERVAEADKRFAEGTYVGSETDRGAIYTVYGEPAEIEFEEHRDVRDPPVELWRYGKKAEPGLNGKRPQKTYRFTKYDDVTVQFRKGGPNDPQTRRRRQPDPFGDPIRPY